MQPEPTEPKGLMGTAPDSRAGVRVVVQLDATVDDGKIPRMYQTQNLSQSGMLVRTRKPLPVGTEVEVQFLFRGNPILTRTSLPGGYGFVEGRAVVVRHTHPLKERIRGMGLQFLGLEEQGRKALVEFLDSHLGRSDPPDPLSSPA